MNENRSPLPRGNGLKKTSGIAIAALLVFGVVVGAVSFSLKGAYATSSITPSSTKFFGASLERVLITDNSKTSNADTISVHVDVAGHVTGAVDISLCNIGNSGTFELFLTTSNTPLVPSAPTYTGSGGCALPNPVIVRANPTATGAANADEKKIPLSSAMQDGDSFKVSYGGQTVTIQYEISIVSASSDRSTAGDGNKVTLMLTDQDGNVDPTGIDKFDATGAGAVAGLVTSTLPMSSAGAFFVETGQNSGVFELQVKINSGSAAGTPSSPGNESVNATLPNAATFTLADKDQYKTGILGATPGTTYVVSGSSSTSATSVTLQNVDGAIALTGTPTLADGIPVKVTDADRNIDTKTKDGFPDATVARVFVTVDGVAGNFNQTMKESDLNTGVFMPDTSGGTISVSVGAADSVGAGGITLTPSTIAGDPDISISYTDPAKSPFGTATFKTVTHVSHTAGTISSDAKAGVTDKFTVTITDPELNTDSGSVQSYVVTFNNANSQTTPVALLSSGAQMGTLTMTVRGSGISTIANNVVLTFIETGANTGVFAATTVDMNKINLDTPGGLKDGDQLQFKYFDQTESPVATSTA